MVLKYRDLCRIKDRARAGLREALDHSGLSDEQKKAFLDGDADSACRGSNLCDVLANWVFLKQINRQIYWRISNGSKEN